MTSQSIPPRRRAAFSRPHGFALVTGLILLVLVSLIALAASRGVRQETVMANNTRERDLAFQAAEAALADAEGKIQPLYHAKVKAGDFSLAGLVDRSDATTEDRVKATTAKYWTDPSPGGYGWFDTDGAVDTSKSIATSQAITGVDQPPRYVVEYLGTAASGECPGQTHYRYRVTALGVGASTATRKLADTRVILQSEIRLCSA